MSLGKELLQRRSELIEAERKLNEKHNKEVESQWELIKHAIQNTPITKDLKYVDLGYFPDVFKENIIKLHNEEFIVFQDRNKSIRLYFSEEDYKKYVDSLKVKNSINSNKKSDFKINNNKQIEEDKKVETVKTKCKKNDFADLMNSLTRVVDWM